MRIFNGDTNEEVEEKTQFFSTFIAPIAKLSSLFNLMNVGDEKFLKRLQFQAKSF